jgi:hypothetical protein
MKPKFEVEVSVSRLKEALNKLSAKRELEKVFIWVNGDRLMMEGGGKEVSLKVRNSGTNCVIVADYIAFMSAVEKLKAGFGPAILTMRANEDVMIVGQDEHDYWVGARML